jgi:Flp pilus assembly protein TadG
MTNWSAFRGRPSRRMAARRGVVSVEFAIVGTGLITLTLAAFGGGMALWVITSMQSAAGSAARCGAIGYDCQTPAQTNAFATTAANTRAGTTVIGPSDIVTSVKAATTCNNLSGKFYTVTMTSSWFASGAMAIMAQPFNLSTITVSSCYPMP